MSHWNHIVYKQNYWIWFGVFCFVCVWGEGLCSSDWHQILIFLPLKCYDHRSKATVNNHKFKASLGLHNLTLSQTDKENLISLGQTDKEGGRG